MEPKILKLLYDQLQLVIAEINRINDSPGYVAVAPKIKQKTIAHLKEITGQLVSIQAAIQAIEAEANYDDNTSTVTREPESSVKHMTKDEIRIWGKRIEASMTPNSQLDFSGTIAHLSPQSILQNQQVMSLLSVATPILTALTVAEAITAAAKMGNPAPDAVLREKAMKDAIHYFELAHNVVKERNAK